MNPIESKLRESAASLQNLLQTRGLCGFVPELAIVLGSGLGAFGENLELMGTIDYEEIAGFPRSTVEGHKGRFLLGKLEGIPCICMQGRVHYYEGYTMPDVVLPIRLMGLLGAKLLLLTNAAGGIDPEFQPGDLMLIRDQISSFVPSPLVGPNDERLGVRFPDMSAIYDPELCEWIKACAAEEGIALREGVYLQTQGPNFESPAEIRMFARLGATAVGMSTAVEAIAARHMGLRVCGISCISNLAAGLSGQALSHEEVQESTARASTDFAALLSAFARRLQAEKTRI